MHRYDFSLSLLSKYRAIQKKYPNSELKQKSRLSLWLLKRLLKKNKSYIPSLSNQIRILFCLDGGIGDIVLALNFLKQFKTHIQSDNTIDICVSAEMSEITKQLCHRHCFINHIYAIPQAGFQYDMVVHFVRVPVLKYVYHKKVSQDNFLLNWIETVQRFNTDFSEYTCTGSTGDALCETYTRIVGRNRLSQGDIGLLLHITTDFMLYPSQNTDDVLKKYDVFGRPFITVQRGTGSADGFNECSTRLWDLDNYHQLCQILKKVYPDTIIIQIGHKACQEIQNTDINLCGKTTFDELLVLLKMAEYHIDGECGMVHLRHFLCQKPSVVLFGPTKKEFYAYAENINISSDVCFGCEWVHDNWRTMCLKTGKEPACLHTISPQFVIKKIREYDYAKNKTIPISIG